MANAEKTSKNEKQRIVTPEFRASYPHLFKPNSIKGSEPKYSITMLFPKNGDLSALKLAIKHAKIDFFGTDQKNWPTNLESPVTDGDLPKFADKEGYKGHWAIKASTNETSKPGVYDEQVNPIVDPAVFYPGCYARAQVFARVWEFGNKQGVHFILDHVQKTRDGKSFGGKKSGSEVFTPITGGNDAPDDDANDQDDQDFT